MTDAVLKTATAADRDRVVALWHQTKLTRPWNDPGADFDRALAVDQATIMIAVKGADLVGSVMVCDDGHRGWVYYLAGDPAHRRAGLGRRMMDAAEVWLRERGAPKIQLMVREDNEAAIGYYEAIGLERQPVVTLGRRLDNGEA